MTVTAEVEFVVTLTDPGAEGGTFSVHQPLAAAVPFRKAVTRHWYTPGHKELNVAWLDVSPLCVVALGPPVNSNV